jgi:hypothetical protein
MAKVGPYREKLQTRQRERATEELKERLGKGEAAAPAKAVEAVWSTRSAAVARAREVLLRGPVTLTEGALASLESAATAVKNHLGRLGAREGDNSKRVVERFDKAIAAHLARVPPQEHAQVSQSLARGLTQLLSKVPPHQTVAAISAYVDLLEGGLPRLSLENISEQTEQLAAAGSASLQKLATAFRGGQGLSTAFNLIPQLLELSAKPGRQGAAEQTRRLEQAIEWVVSSSPRTGPSLEQAAEFSARVQHAQTLEAAVAEGAKLPAPHPFPVVVGPVPHAEGALAALRTVAEKDPANAALGARLPDFASRLAALGKLPASEQAWTQFAELIKRAEGQPGSEMILDAVLARGEFALAHPEILKQARDQGIPGLIALKLGQEGAAISPELKTAVNDLDGLPEGQRLIAALAQHAAAGSTQAPLAFGLYQLATERGVGSDAELSQYIERFDQALAVVGQFATPRQMGGLAHALAVNVSPEQFTPEHLQQVNVWAKQLHARVPQLSVDQLIASQGKRGGLLSLVANKPEMLAKMGPYVNGLAQVIAATPGASDAEVHRFALNVAMELGRMEGAPELYNQFVVPDVRKALTTPASLKMPEGSTAKTLGELYTQHPEFPPELLATAATHLSSEQMTWLSTALKTTRNKVMVRGIRDAVIGSLALARPAFLEALRTSPSPEAAKSAAAYVGLEYRQGRGAGIPWQQLEEGLAAGKDVSGEIRNAKAAGALKKLDLHAPPGTQIPPEAMEEFSRINPLIGSMASFLAATPQAFVGAAALFKESLEAMLGGHDAWQAKKYGGPIGERQLAGVTPEGIAAWKAERLTVPNAPDVKLDPHAGLALQTAKADLEKLRAMLAKVKIRSGGVEVGLENLAALRAERAAGIEQLRAVAKGTPEHKQLSDKLGSLQDPLALLELRESLEAFSHAAPDRQEAALAAVKSALRGTRGGLGSLGGSALQRFAKETEYAVSAVSEAKASTSKAVRPEAGLFVDDTDTLEGYLASYGNGSCLNPTNGANRVGLLAYLVDPQYRIERVFQDGKVVGRGILRLMDVTIAGKRQKVLWADAPFNTGGSNLADPAMRKLYFQHALAKAKAMGVPLYTPGHEALAIAQASGLNAIQTQGVVTIDMGHYKAHQSEGLQAPGYYFVAGPAAQTHNGANVAADAVTFDVKNSGYFVETKPAP